MLRARRADRRDPSSDIFLRILRRAAWRHSSGSHPGAPRTRLDGPAMSGPTRVAAGKKLALVLAAALLTVLVGLATRRAGKGRRPGCALRAFLAGRRMLVRARTAFSAGRGAELRGGQRGKSGGAGAKRGRGWGGRGKRKERGRGERGRGGGWGRGRSGVFFPTAPPVGGEWARRRGSEGKRRVRVELSGLVHAVGVLRVFSHTSARVRRRPPLDAQFTALSPIFFDTPHRLWSTPRPGPSPSPTSSGTVAAAPTDVFLSSPSRFP